MRITIEIENDKPTPVYTHQEFDEDQDAEVSWFKKAIGHCWHYLEEGERLTDENGVFAVQYFKGGKLFIEDAPVGVDCVAYYQLPGLPKT